MKTWIGLIALVAILAACAPQTQTGDETANLTEQIEQTESTQNETPISEETEDQVVTVTDTDSTDDVMAEPTVLRGNWLMQAINSADSRTFDIVVAFDDASSSLTGKVYAPNEGLEREWGTVEGQMNESTITFRINFSEQIGGGYWDVNALYTSESFSGSYESVNGAKGTVNAARLIIN